MKFIENVIESLIDIAANAYVWSKIVFSPAENESVLRLKLAMFYRYLSGSSAAPRHLTPWPPNPIERIVELVESNKSDD